MATTEAPSWRDVPRGYYALPIEDVTSDERPESTDVKTWYTRDCPVIGHQLYERRVPRTYSTGRTVGKDSWRVITMMADGVDPTLVRANRDLLDEEEYIACILAEPSHYQAEFGKLTGKCRLAPDGHLVIER